MALLNHLLHVTCFGLLNLFFGLLYLCIEVKFLLLQVIFVSLQAIIILLAFFGEWFWRFGWIYLDL